LVVFLGAGLTIGTTQYSFGEFAAPLRAEFGWSQTALNLSLSFSLVSALLAPLIGRIADRWGVRPVLFWSLLSAGAGFLLRPLISELWHWYLFSALVYLGFPGATVLAAGKLVPLWYPATRGRMMGVVTTGHNVGGLLMPPLAATLIAAAGWPAAYLVFGALLVAVAIAALLVVTEDRATVVRAMRRSGRAAQVPVAGAVATGLTLAEALRSRRFWLVLIGLVGGTFTYQGILTQLRQHFEELGFSPAAATAGLAVVAAMGIGSKLVFGRASEHLGARGSAIVSMLIQALGVVVMATAASPATAWVGIIIFGAGFGGLGALLVLVVQEVVGMKQFGTIVGVVQMTFLISWGGGPLLAGRVHDATGSFSGAFLLVAGIFVAGAAALAVARPSNNGHRRRDASQSVSG
jgi:MFS family permease